LSNAGIVFEKSEHYVFKSFFRKKAALAALLELKTLLLRQI